MPTLLAASNLAARTAAGPYRIRVQIEAVSIKDSEFDLTVYPKPKPAAPKSKPAEPKAKPTEPTRTRLHVRHACVRACVRACVPPGMFAAVLFFPARTRPHIRASLPNRLFRA